MRRCAGFRRARWLEAGEALLDRLPRAGPAVQADFDPRPAAGGHVGQQGGEPPQLPGPTTRST